MTVKIAIDNEIYLRELVKEDAESLHRLSVENEDRLKNFLSVQITRGVDSTLSHIAEAHEAKRNRIGLYLGILRNDKLVGQVRLELRGNVCVLAYWLTRESLGNGVTYRVLRELLPYAANIFWKGDKLSEFEAEIKAANTASQKVVSKLGFKKLEASCSNDAIINAIAPRLTERWVLPASNDLASVFVEAEKLYRSSVSGFPKRTWHAELIDPIAFVVNEAESFSGEEHLEETASTILKQVQNLRLHEELLEKLLSIAAPGRAAYQPPMNINLIELESLQGLWVDSNKDEDLSKVIVSGSKAIKGFAQDLQTDTKGNVIVSRCILERISNGGNTACFKDADSNETIAWTRIDGTVAHDSQSLDGIWKTPRCFAGIWGKTMVSTTAIWRLEAEQHSWKLVISEDTSMNLAIGHEFRVEWRSERPALSYSRRKRNIETLIWTKVCQFKDTSLSLFASTENLIRSIYVEQIAEARICEIKLLLSICPTSRGWSRRIARLYQIDEDGDKLIRELEGLRLSAEAHSNHLKCVKILRAKLQNSAVKGAVDRCTCMLEKIVLDENSGAFSDIQDYI